MKALILAAGEGTRLRPLTETTPKVMVPIGGKPALEHIIALCRKHGIVELALNLHYLPDQITDYFGDGSKFGVKIRYLHEAELSGDAGPIKKLEDYFEDTFLVMTGDNLTTVDLTKMAEFHRQKWGLATVAVVQDDDRESIKRRGCVLLGDDGKISRFEEKLARPFSNLVSGHIWIFENRIFDYIPRDRHYMIGYQLVPELFRSNEPIYGHLLSNNEYLEDFGTIERYQKCLDDFPSLASALYSG